MLKSGLIVAFFTLLSRLFGLARELFIAATFGSSAIADCVNVAFKFPNFFRRIFGEGALSAVFIPIFNEKLIASKQQARIFSGEIFTLLLLALIIITILMQIFMPYLMFIVAPGFVAEDSKYELAILLCRITMPYMIFVSITALFGGILNSVGKFAAFAFVPILMNISVIAVTMALRKEDVAPEYGVAISLLVAGILQVSFMFFCIYKNGLSFPLSFNPKDKDVNKLMRNMGPATLSSGTQQLNLFISQSIASFIPGAVSILSYADRLYQLPLALIGITFGTILLPELSKIYSSGNFDKANFLQNRATQLGFLISMPATIGLFILSHPIIHLIFERGEFTSSDTALTANALAVFSLGLPAYVLAKILIPIFYANQDTKTPFYISVKSLIANISLNILLMIPFGYLGIAAGSSIAAWYNVHLLNKHAKKYGSYKLTAQTYTILTKVTICSVLMGAFVYFASKQIGSYFYSDSSAMKIISVLGTIAVAGTIYTGTIFAFKLHKILLNKYAKN